MFSDFVNDYYLKIGSTLTKVNIVTKGLNEVEKSNGVFVPTNTLVIDGGAISYTDSMGIEALQNAYDDGKRVQVNVLYADFSGKLHAICFEDFYNIRFVFWAKHFCSQFSNSLMLFQI